jgi:hypothetical protein
MRSSCEKILARTLFRIHFRNVQRQQKDRRLHRGVKWSTALVVAALMSVGALSCTHQAVKPISEPAYAKAALETLLAARDAGEYEQYVGSFPPDVRKPTEQEFERSVATVKEAWGKYVPGSLRFSDAQVEWESSIRSEFTVVNYYGKFTLRPDKDVIVQIVFANYQGKRVVDSIGFGAR